MVGHRNPDTDSIVSAHVLAWMLNNERAMQDTPAIPVRLGEPNPQTAWLFEEAGVPLPEERHDCRITIGDIASPGVSVSTKAPLSEALGVLHGSETELVGVIGADGKLEGVIGGRTRRINELLQSRVEDYTSTLLDMDLLIRGLGLTELRQHQPIERASRIVIAASSADCLEGELRAGDVVLCGNYPEAIRLADRARAKAVICSTHSIESLAGTIAEIEVPIYHSSDSIVSLIGKLPGCVPCWAVMEEEFGRAEVGTNLEETRKALSESPEGLVVLSAGKFVGTCHQYHLLSPPRPQISLVDHFEKAQSIEGFEEAEVVQVIDHHRIGDVETDGPVEIDCRQWGSTASILYSRMEIRQITPPREIALLLLGALLSDTLGLHSPTTTEKDEQIAEQLATLADIDLAEFSRTLLEKNDQVASGEPERLLQTDCKEFRCGDVRFLVSQLETVSLENLTERREAELTGSFRKLIESRATAFGVLMFTDVLKQESLLRLVTGDQKWAKILFPDKAFASSAPRWVEPDCVSRKRQIIPLIMERVRSA